MDCFSFFLSISGDRVLEGCKCEHFNQYHYKVQALSLDN
nr:MAG TPA: hypothetical protein [Caudoviricetes sp.]